MPNWLILGLLSSMFGGAANITDKVIVDRYSPSVLVYGFWLAIWEVFAGGITLAIVGSNGINTKAVGGGIIFGFVLSLGYLLFLKALKMGQVSRVVPLMYLHPLIVTGIAVLVLGETVSNLALMAILLAVAGAILVSYQGKNAETRTPMVIIPMVLTAAILVAISTIGTKYFTDETNPWHYSAGYRWGYSIGLLSITLCIKEVRRQAPGMIRNGKFIGMVILSEGVLISATFLLKLGALTMGPVSLISALGSIQPALVLMYSLILASRFPSYFASWINKQTLIYQSLGVLAITIAVMIISLDST